MNITEHPLYRSLTLHGERLAARVRQVPGQRWRWLCLALVSLWIAHNLASAFWLVVPSPDLEQPPLASPVEAAGGSAQATDVDLAALQEANLFGQGGVAPPPEPEPAVLPGIEQEAVDTSLNLRLQGVMTSSNPDNAWAIIADGNDQALYTVGDKLPQGNATLVKVLEQRVILDNNGRYESLWLYSKEDAQQRAGANPGRGYSNENDYSDAREYGAPPEEGDTLSEDDDSDYRYYQEQAEAAAAGGSADSEPAPEESDNEVDVRTLPASAAEGVQSLSDVVRFTAARGDDGMMGYQVQPGRNRELFEQAGLQAGDVVTAVNGIGLDDPRQIRAVYQELQTAEQAELSILRNGEPVSVQITLDSAR